MFTTNWNSAGYLIHHCPISESPVRECIKAAQEKELMLVRLRRGSARCDAGLGGAPCRWSSGPAGPRQSPDVHTSTKALTAGALTFLWQGAQTDQCTSLLMMFLSSSSSQSNGIWCGDDGTPSSESLFIHGRPLDHYAGEAIPADPSGLEPDRSEVDVGIHLGRRVAG